MQILAYLASPAGATVLQEIIDKSDDFRLRLKIPEAGGTFSVKLSAGSIRQLVRQTIGQKQNQTSGGGVDRSIDFPPSCELTKQLIAEHPEFLNQISDLRVIDVQHWVDQFHQLHPVNTVYDAVVAFPNVTPLGQSWVMEFRPPDEMKAVGFARAAVMFTAMPAEPDFRLPPNVHVRPAWAMSTVIVFQGVDEVK